MNKPKIVIGLDTGEKAGKTFACQIAAGSTPWLSSNPATFTSYNNPQQAIDALAQLAPQFDITVILESSAYNVYVDGRQKLVDTAKRNGITLYPINPRNTKNRRQDHHVDKSDKNDAWILANIFLEGIIPRTRFSEFTPSLDSLIRARQLDYNTDDARFNVPGIDDFMDAIASQEAPDFALTARVAETYPSGTYRGRKTKWVKGVSFYTLLLRAIDVANGPAPSYRKLKAVFRERGIARANLKHWGLGKAWSGLKDRKAIQKAQDLTARWMFDQVLTVRRIQLAEQSASLLNRTVN